VYAEERQHAIATLVSERGRLAVTAVAEEFGVTTETVRRDLALLERAGMVRRVHGGAVPAGALTLVETGLGERHGTRTEAKRAIAAAALDLLPATDGSVILDGGSTTAALADALPPDRRLYVATNSVPIAARLSARCATCGSTSSSSARTGSARGTASAPRTRRRRPPSGRWCGRPSG
jgi:DeoR family fructose operon transcriptional repressor